MDCPRPRYLIWLILALWIGIPACATPPPPPDPTPTPVGVPTVTFPQAATTLCSAATHLRLVPRVQGAWPADGVAEWTLAAADAAAPLISGTWMPESYELFAPFPGNAPLPAGDYALALHLDGEALARHPFAIAEAAPAITHHSLALTPAGPDVTRLAQDTRLVYIRYTYAGGCAGAPVWATVRHADAILCTRRATLPQASGTDWIACYREDGQSLEPGTYRVELTLMGTAQSTFEFEVDAPPPPPTPTPTPPPPQCDALFTATGLAPDGTPILPGERFEWYTQVVHAGSYCEHLQAGTPWASYWFRNGQPVRSAEGHWAGGASGLLWDNLSGTAEAPFLLPGTYSVTLHVDTTLVITGEFRLIGYVREQPAP